MLTSCQLDNNYRHFWGT